MKIYLTAMSQRGCHNHCHNYSRECIFQKSQMFCRVIEQCIVSNLFSSNEEETSRYNVLLLSRFSLLQTSSTLSLPNSVKRVSSPAFLTIFQKLGARSHKIAIKMLTRAQFSSELALHLQICPHSWELGTCNSSVPRMHGSSLFQS